MFFFVITCELALSLLCFYVAWKLRAVGPGIARAADVLEKEERRVALALRKGPEAISKGESSARQLREKYRFLQHQIRRVDRVLGLFPLLGILWHRVLEPGRSPRARKSSKKRGKRRLP